MKTRLFVFILFIFITGSLSAVEPSGDELKMAADWQAPFWNTNPRENAQSVGLSVQSLTPGLTVPYKINTSRDGGPVNINGQTFEKGMFVHANAEIEVWPPKNAKKFTAFFGLEKNGTTSGGQGSVRYVIKQGDKKRFFLPVLRGDMDAVPIQIDLEPDQNHQPLCISVTDSGDGYACDHGTIGDPRLIADDGSETFITDLPPVDKNDSEVYPFSFCYDGVSSRTFLQNWPREISSEDLGDGRTVRTLTFTDPDGVLQVTARFVVYADFPTLEWTLYFKNLSDQKSPVISEIRSFDKSFSFPEPCVLHHAYGSDCRIDDFQHFQSLIRQNNPLEFHAEGGRGTDVNWPYYNVESGNQGVIVVIGWPGQWKTTFTAKVNGFHFDTGQELTHFALNPGECVRSPLSVVQFWKRDNWLDAQNIWRQWMIRYNVPRHDGKLETSILSAASSYWYDVMGNATDESQIFFIKRYLEEKIPIDYWWMDAGWYRCNNHQWHRTGTWEIDTERFPEGLKKVTDFARSQGVKNIVWFEPERVFGDTKLAKEHQDWLLGEYQPEGNQLLNLGNPEAWNWCVSMVDSYIKNEGIEFYRQDFNMRPNRYWTANDAEDRQGITEIRHIEGYLAFWDEIRKRNPSIQIDTCASGGRRLDLETLRRSVPLTCSDYFIEPTGAQMQTLNLSLWVPFHGKNMLILDDYHLRSFFMPFMRFGADMRPNAEYALGWHPQPHIAPKGNIRDFDSARRNVALWKELLVPLYTADFYPLGISQDVFKEGTWGSSRRSWTSSMVSPSFEEWAAWQFNSVGEKKGVVQVFRRVQSDYEAKCLKLYGLEPNSTYEMTNVDTGEKSLFTGEDLMNNGFTVTLKNKPDAAIFSYKIADCRTSPEPAERPAPAPWGDEVKTVFYPSDADNTWQPALCYIPETNDAIPLVVELHAWSHDYRQPHMKPMFDEAKKRNWAMIGPDFRGRNDRPEACGSDLAVADIVSAVEYMKKRCPVDNSRIYITGISGGGFMTMLMAGRHPEIWAGTSVWVGISDLAAWHHQTEQAGLNYAKMLEQVCGGAPGCSAEVDEQYKRRSAKTWLPNAGEVPISLNVGIHDGHGGNSVPVSQTLNAFNILVDEKDRLSAEQIETITATEKIPEELQDECVDDSTFGEKKVLFRRSGHHATVTVFEGGHEGNFNAAFEWLSQQKKSR